MNDLLIHAASHDYLVSFTGEVRQALHNELRETDVVIIDGKVRELHRQTLEDLLQHQRCITIQASEEQKSYPGVAPVISQLIAQDFRRDHRLVAIGGGITQDVTAFIASILYRGVDWLFLPTTLLAMCDSCIGSKTSINFESYKNQLGGFHPPRRIIIDPAFLDTLPGLEIQSGLGEMCHFFIVSGEEDFARFKREFRKARLSRETLLGLIARSLEIKKKYIESDEFDRRERQLFNYGHSFGHAIETLTNYRTPHGIAVAYGMDMANFISVKLGFITETLRLEILEVLREIWREVPLDRLTPDQLVAVLQKDKKNVPGELRLILNRGLGRIAKTGVEPGAEFREWLREYLQTFTQ